jgi:hypothetical protein
MSTTLTARPAALSFAAGEARLTLAIAAAGIATPPSTPASTRAAAARPRAFRP